MIVLLHILFAVVSVAYTVSLLFGAFKRFSVAVSLLVLTVASGVVLIVENPARLYHVCAVGLVYTAVTLALMAVARVRQRHHAPQA